MFRKPPILYALAALSIVVVFLFVAARPVLVLPRISLAPAFVFTDQDNQRLSHGDLRGHIVLYNFTYTHCAAPCSQIDQRLHSVQEQIGQQGLGVPVELVTISFDPERDSGDRLRAYARQIEADLDNWHFVSGDPTQLKDVVGGGFNTKFIQTNALIEGGSNERSGYTERHDCSVADLFGDHFGVVGKCLSHAYL